MAHPFADLLRQYRARKAGLTQTRLAQLAGYDHAVLTRMCQGKKDLTGPTGRERVVRLIEILAGQGALSSLDEANALLLAADMPPLFGRQPVEASLISRLASAPHQPGQHLRRTNLPAPLSRFIGRTREAEDVQQLLGQTRLLTLTGAGGAGKTRLAQHVAAGEQPHFHDGVWYAELAPLSDGARVAEAVASAFGLIVAERSAQQQVIDYLRDRHVLLVLDNCEHLIDPVAEFAARLLRACPQVTALATSREALNVEGETAWRVPPMQADEAAQLFVERARAARPGINLSVRDEAVAHICRRLDGIPLAIELAAVRVSGMSLADLAARLDSRFGLLAGTRRGALPRQQTLRATIDWSYDLLAEPERILLRKLSVFVGGWTIELAEQACSNLSPLPSRTSDVVPLMLGLVSKSLVVMDAERRDGVARYGYLETTREYAREKLIDHGDLQTMQRRHAEAVAALTTQSRRPTIHRQREWMTRLEREYPNLHAALAWSFGPQGDAQVGCRIFGDLQLFWYGGSHAGDAQRWARLARNALAEQMGPRVCGAVWLVSTVVLGSSLTLEEILAGFRQALAYYTAVGDPAGMADAMENLAGSLLNQDLNNPEATHLLEESIGLARSVGDTLVEHCSLKSLGEAAERRMDFERAEALFLENIRLCRETGDFDNFAQVSFNLAYVHMDRQQFREALLHARQAVDTARQIGAYWYEVAAECLAADAVCHLGDVQAAVASAESSLALTREHLTEERYALPLITLSKALTAAREYARAQAVLDEALRINQRLWPTPPLGPYGRVFDGMACVAAGQNDARRSALLFGAADREIGLLDANRGSYIDWELAPYIARARLALGEQAFETLRAQGCAMTRDQAVTYAFNHQPTVGMNDHVANTGL